MPAAVPPEQRRLTAVELRAGAFGFLRRNWRLILATTLAALAFGVLFALFAPTKYRSSAQLLIDPRGLQILKNEITRSGDSTDGNLVDIENQRYILLSRSVLATVVEREKLEENPLFGGAPPGMLARLSAAIGVKRPTIDRRARAVQALADIVEVVRGERAYVLDVVVTTSDANLSATLANIIARTYLDAQNEARSEVARRASEELSKRAEDLRHQVQASEEKVERYRAERNLIQTPTGRLLGEQQISDLSTQMGLVRARIAEAQARVESVERFRKSGQNFDSLSESLSSPGMVALRAQYAQAAQQEASLATQLGPRHPALVQAQEQLRDIRRQIAAESERIVGAARSDLARAKASEASLQKQAGDVRVSSDKNNAALVELRDLERAAETNRAVYQSFLSRSKELGESQGIDSTNARVISPAIPASKPSGAPAPLVLAGALLFGLTLGAGLGYARERFDDRIRSRREVSEMTGLPLLASFRTTNPGGANKFAGTDLVPDRSAFRNLLSRLGVGQDDVRSIAFVGRHDAILMTQLVVGLAEFARWENLDVALVDCMEGAKSNLADAFDEDSASGADRRRGRIDVVHWSELMRGGSLRRLRDEFEHVADGVDIMFLDTPSPLENNDAHTALDLVDRIVLAFQPADLDRNALAATIEALREYEDRIEGFVFIGEGDLA